MSSLTQSKGAVRARARALPTHEEDRELLGLARPGEPTNGVSLDTPGHIIVLDLRVRHQERLAAAAREIARRAGR